MPSPQETDAGLPARPGTRSRLPFTLSGVMIAVYFGFIFLVAYHKEFLATTLVPGLSWGILLGASVIIIAWLLTLIYVMSFNKKGVR